MLFMLQPYGPDRLRKVYTSVCQAGLESCPLARLTYKGPAVVANCQTCLQGGINMVARLSFLLWAIPLSISIMACEPAPEECMENFECINDTTNLEA